MARKKDQDARRAQLAAATERAVLDRGLAGLRLRDIAEEAGLTSGAVLYYYEDVDDLVQETYHSAVDRFCSLRQQRVDEHTDARRQLAAAIDAGVATGPDDTLPRLLFELLPRTLHSRWAAMLDSTLTERQIAVYQGVLILGREQGHFTLADPPALIAGNFVALEDGRQLDVLVGRTLRTESVKALHSYARAATGCELATLTE
jgi:AcrR family transcriptional regulator